MENSKEKKRSLLADGALIIMAFIWGSGFVVTKNALDLYSPCVIIAYRLFIGAVVLAIAFWARIKRNLNKNSLLGGAVIGGFMFLGFYFQTTGLVLTTASKGAFLTASYVVMVPFISSFIDKRHSLKKNMVFIAFMMLIGIFILSFNPAESLYFSAGDLLVIVCALFFALHVVSIDYYNSKGNDPIVLTVVQMAVAAVLSFFAALLGGEGISSFMITPGFAIVYLGVVASGIAFLIQNVAQKYTSSEHAGILMSLESVFGTVLSVLILKEAFSTRVLMGCVIIFLSVILCVRDGVKNDQKQTQVQTEVEKQECRLK